jgi:hypothetical protein
MLFAKTKNGMIKMNNPNYILKITEDIDVYENPATPKIKKAVFAVLVVLLVASFVFGKNLFREFSLMPKVMFIVLVFGVLFSGKKETRQFPVELHFFDDRIEIHRMEVHYSGGDVKRELYIFNYEAAPVCIYSDNTRFARIKGMAHGEWYNYTKAGALEEKPERVRDMEGICYFRVSKSCDVYLPSVLKTYTPIKVEIE